MIHSGLVSITFRGLSPFEIVELTGKAGLEGIEWGADVHVPHGNLKKAREVARATADVGLCVAAYGSYYRVGVSETQGLAFEKVLETAVALKAPTVRVWAGDKGSQYTSPYLRQTIVEESRRIADMAGAEGISISFEYHADTLTDTNASAMQLLGEVRHDNVWTYWQPPGGAPAEYCLEGLQAVLTRLSNVHVFHWLKKGDDIERRELAEGAEHWQRYLKVIKRSGRDHYAMLEFVMDDSPENFLKDARILKSWLGDEG